MTKAPSIVSVVLLAGLVCAAPARAAEKAPTVERLRVEVLASYPHDRTAFTQGLLWHQGSLYESTGLYALSTLRRVDPTSGEVLERVDLDDSLFGEGLVRVGDRLIQLTWQEGLALVYETAGLVPIDQLPYSGHGWGLAFDGRRLIMTDGSSRLTFRDPETFREQGSVEVIFDGAPLREINEMESVDGELYANVLNQDRIYRIDPDSGQVGAVIDASGLLSVMEKRGAGVLNGIAYDPSSKTFWITGKNWPRIFQVVFVPATGS